MDTEPNLPGGLWLVVGASGSGKTTVVRALTRHFAGWLSEAISHTSRPPREGEVSGVDYHFVSTEEFIRMRDAGELAEFVAYPPGFPPEQQKFYGVTRQEIDSRRANGNDCIIIVEYNGAKQILELYPEAQVIVLKAPTPGDLEDRLRARGDKPEAILQRLTTAALEEETALTIANFIIPAGSRENTFHAARIVIGGLDRELGDRITSMNFSGDVPGRTVVAESWRGTAESIKPVE